MTVPTPNFKTLAEYNHWSRAHMRDLNRLAVTAPDEWERIAIRIGGLLRRISEDEERKAAAIVGEAA